MIEWGDFYQNALQFDSCKVRIEPTDVRASVQHPGFCSNIIITLYTTFAHTPDDQMNAADSAR